MQLIKDYIINEMNEDKNYNSIDIFKFIFSICVIANHTHPLENCNNKIILALYYALLALAVPFFFISTGYLIGKKNISKGKDCNDIELIKKHLYKIIKLYIVCSVIYFPLTMMDYARNGKGFLYNILLYIKDFIFVGGYNTSYLLWYLLSTIYSLLLIYFLSKRRYNIKKITIICFIMTSFGLIISKLVSIDVHNFLIIDSFLNIIKNTIINGKLFNGFFYISIGMMISTKQQNKKILPLIVFIISFLTCSFVSSFLGFLLMIEVLSLFCLIIQIKTNNKPIYKYLRKLSTYNYFSHMWVWNIYCYLIYGEKTYSFDSFIITLIICIIMGLIHITINNNRSKSNLINKV